MFPAVFKEFLSVLNARKVKYLVIGGYAVSLHAQPRATKDLDLFVSPDAANAKALCGALVEFGAPLGTLTPRDFTKPNLFYRMGRAPLSIDIILAISGVGFSTAWKNRVEVEIDSASGLTAAVISSADLVAAKLASARPRDLADVADLRQAENARENSRGKRASKRRR